MTSRWQSWAAWSTDRARPRRPTSESRAARATGMLIKKGEIVQRMPESELLGALREELLHWNEN